MLKTSFCKTGCLNAQWGIAFPALFPTCPECDVTDKGGSILDLSRGAANQEVASPWKQIRSPNFQGFFFSFFLKKKKGASRPCEKAVEGRKS